MATCLLALLTLAPADAAPLPAGCLARLGSTRFRTSGHGERVVGSPDGRHVMVAGFGASEVFDAATGRRLRGRPADDSGAMEIDAAFDPAGGLVVLGIDDDANATVTRSRPGDFGPAGVTKLKRFEFSGVQAFSPDSRLLVTASEKRLRVYDTLAGAKPVRLRARLKSGVSGVRFSADGRWLFVQAEKHILVFDRPLGALAARLRYANQPMPFAVSADGARVAADVDGKVIVRDAITGKRVARFEPPEAAQELAFVGRTLVAHVAGELLAYDPDRRAKPPRVVGRVPLVSSLTGLADGRTLAALGGFGAVSLYDVPTGRLLPQSADPDGDALDIYLPPDGRVLTYSDGWHAWDAAGRGRTPLGPRMVRTRDDPTDLPSAVSLDGGTIARCVPPADGGEARVELLDAATGRKAAEFAPKVGRPVAVWFGPGGRSVVVVGESACVYDVRTRAMASVKLGRTTGISPEQVAGTDQVLVVVAEVGDGKNGAGTAQQIVGYDLVAGRKLFESKFDGFPEAVRVSADGRTAAVVYRGELDPHDWLLILDARTGAVARRLPVESAGPSGIALSPDGRTVAVTGFDAGTRLYETATGTVRAVFEHPVEVNVMASRFAADGSRFAAATSDGMVYVWDVAGRSLPPPADAGKLWAALGDPDAAVAFAAVRGLARVPADAVALLERKLPPAAAVDPAMVARWVNDLDSPRYAVRAAAAAALEKVADRATAQLTALAAKTPSAEVRGRLLSLIEAASGANPVNLRAVRAVEAIEWVLNDPSASAAAAHPAARRLRAAWAGGQPGARLTTEAIASQRR